MTTGCYKITTHTSHRSVVTQYSDSLCKSRRISGGSLILRVTASFPTFEVKVVFYVLFLKCITVQMLLYYISYDKM